MDQNTTRNERDLIVALAEDYLNIFLACPEENRIDIIKLNGFLPDDAKNSWSGRSLSTFLGNYIMNRIYPDDRAEFTDVCSAATVKETFSSNHKFEGTYRVVENQEIHYFSYKFIKISGDDEPLRVVAAFRNIDQIVGADRERMDELVDLKNIMASSEMGTWHITIVEGMPNRMSVDDRMKTLLGIPQDAVMTEEQIYESWFSRIDSGALESVLASVKMMQNGHRSENTYKWLHPTLGERYVRCGGTAVPVPGGFILSGYHYDVTDQVKKDMRYNMVIKSLAHSYEFLNYIRMYNGTYITYADNMFGGDADKTAPIFKDVADAIRKMCSEEVYEKDRYSMSVFADLSTINERMKYRNVLIREFKNVEMEWHEWSYIVAERNPDRSIKHLIWAVRKIDDEKQLELRRQQILEDNIAANKAKTMFLQNMSHEIRTPLNAMFGFAQLLGLPDGSWTMEEKEQYNSYVYSSYSMLDMLIGDIIDIADSGHGNYRIEISDLLVNTICENAMMSVEVRRPADVRMYFTSELPDDYRIQSDGRRIQQVLINYLTNACKYTRKGEIHLHCSRTEHPGKLTFSVTDTGMGIPADKAEVIFNRFTKLNNFIQGSGLGLNICMMVAEKLGGEVYLDKSYTDGARFVFVINDNPVS